MRDYTDLIKRLNEFSAEHEMHGGITAEAADAIEELQKDVNFHKFNSEFWEDKYNSLADEKWIPVTERLPEHEYGESTSVLTADLYGVMRVTYFDGGNWCWPTGEALTTMRVAPITHWMPLPKPLNEE